MWAVKLSEFNIACSPPSFLLFFPKLVEAAVSALALFSYKCCFEAAIIPRCGLGRAQISPKPVHNHFVCLKLSFSFKVKEPSEHAGCVLLLHQLQNLMFLVLVLPQSLVNVSITNHTLLQQSFCLGACTGKALPLF